MTASQDPLADLFGAPPLPEHLPREEIAHHPDAVRPGCGGIRFSRVGEDVTEVLGKVPTRLKVIRHIRPKLSCRSCERIGPLPNPRAKQPHSQSHNQRQSNPDWR